MKSLDYDSLNIKPNIVHIFDDPCGFTAAMVITDSRKEILYEMLSTPESYVHHSSNIVCISFKDETKTIMHSKVNVDLTFVKRNWLLWELAETVEAIFSWESTQYEVTLKLFHKTGSEVSITHHIGCLLPLLCLINTLESHPLGTQIISKVALSSTTSLPRRLFRRWKYLSACSQYLGNSLKRDQIQFLVNLRGHRHSFFSHDSFYLRLRTGEIFHRFV